MTTAADTPDSAGTGLPFHFIFDIGNVLLNFDLAALQARIVRETGTPAERIASEWTAPATVAVESGQVPPQDYYADFARRMSLGWTYEEWTGAWADIYSVNETGYGIFTRLRDAGRPVHMLSNLAPYNVPAIRKAIPGFFPEGVTRLFSFELKAHKPAPAIYRRAAAVLGVEPRQCVFIDDVQANVNGARDTGMHGIRYSDRNAADVEAFINTFR